MFWEFGFHTSSAIDEILTKPDVTLEQLLDESDILQECRANNKKLLDFLCSEDSIDRLLTFVTMEPPEEMDEKTKFKYPNLACEILSSDAWSILDEVSKTPNLSRLWSILDSEDELHPLLASFLVKIISQLFRKKSEEMSNDFKSREGLLDKIFRHLSTPAIANLLSLFVREEVGLQTWLLEEQHVIDRIVELYNPANETSQAVLEVVTDMLDDVVVGCRQNRAFDRDEEAETPLALSKILREETISKLLQYAFRDSSRLHHALKVLISIISEPPQLDEEATVTPEQRKQHLEEIQPVFRALLPFVKDFHALLASDEEAVEIASASGVFIKRYGFTRLTATTLLSQLIVQSNEEMEAELIELNTLGLLLDQFFEYAENNLLHKNVYDVISAVFSRKDSKLFKQLFEDVDLLSKMVNGWKRNKEAEEETKAHRLGYMGYLVRLGQDLLAMQDTSTDPIKLFYASADDSQRASVKEEWESIVSTSLSPWLAIQAGPLGAKPPSASYSSDEEDDFYYTSAFTGATTTESVVDEETDSFVSYRDFLKNSAGPDMPENLMDVDSDEEEDVMASYGQTGAFSQNAGMDYDVDAEDIDPAKALEMRILDGLAEGESQESDHDTSAGPMAVGTMDGVTAMDDSGDKAGGRDSSSSSGSSASSSSHNSDDEGDGQDEPSAMATDDDVAESKQSASTSEAADNDPWAPTSTTPSQGDGMRAEDILLSPRSSQAVAHIASSTARASSPIAARDFGQADESSESEGSPLAADEESAAASSKVEEETEAVQAEAETKEGSEEATANTQDDQEPPESQQEPDAAAVAEDNVPAESEQKESSPATKPADAGADVSSSDESPERASPASSPEPAPSAGGYVRTPAPGKRKERKRSLPSTPVAAQQQKVRQQLNLGDGQSQSDA